jgi:hypothetical protein
MSGTLSGGWLGKFLEDQISWWRSGRLGRGLSGSIHILCCDGRVEW